MWCYSKKQYYSPCSYLLVIIMTSLILWTCDLLSLTTSWDKLGRFTHLILYARKLRPDKWFHTSEVRKWVSGRIWSRPEPRYPDSPPSTLINPIVTALVPICVTVSAESITKACPHAFYFQSSSPSSISSSLSCFHGVRALKLNLVVKIVALGLYRQSYSASPLGVRTPILLTWKYVDVNVTGRGVWNSGIWKPLWKISHSPSFLHPFLAGSEIKLGLWGHIPNFGAIGCM